jgi:hypothetical protein
MQSPLVEQAFAPMPLRVRGVLETLDVAIKAYKQYFWVLLAWAAIVNVLNSIPFVNYVSYLFTPPLLVGATCCCVAAAVRGQSVTFRQCWRFTEPRYWSMVAMHVVAGIVMMVLFFVLLIGGSLAIGFTISQLAEAFATLPMAMQIIAGVVASFVVLLAFSLAMTVMLSWHTLTTIVVCMEDDRRNTGALSRAWELMTGQWKAVLSLMMLLMLGMLVLQIVIGATAALLIGLPSLRDMLNGNVSDNFFWQAMIGYMMGSMLLLTIYMPIHYLAATLLYLDLRVRKEALDIEWTAHTTAPPINEWATQNAPATFASGAAPQSTFGNEVSYQNSFSSPIDTASSTNPTPQSTLDAVETTPSVYDPATSSLFDLSTQPTPEVPPVPVAIKSSPPTAPTETTSPAPADIPQSPSEPAPRW